MKQTQVLAAAARVPPAAAHTTQIVPAALRQEWGDCVWWDRASKAPKAITRDQVGRYSGVQDPLLEGSIEVTLADGNTVRCRPVFDLVKEYAAHFTPQTVEDLE